MVNKPGFFKAYIPSLGEVNQKIPIQPIQGTWPAYIRMRDRYYNLWRVQIETVGDSSYFKDGWVNFIDDNKVRDGDILVYQYSYPGLFDFKIFGSNGSMTEGVGGHLVSEDDDVVAGNVNASTSQPKKSKKQDYFGVEIFKSGVARQPKNPYFVTKISKSRPFQVYIPMEVINIHGLKLGERIVLFDREGRNFHAKISKWSDGRTFCSEGWASLCKVNLVGEDDTCICEFVRRDGDLCIHVNFLRKNKQ